MASQPSRPWFRLGSFVRPVSSLAPAPTPASAPAPMVIPSMRPMAPAPEPTPPPTTTALPPPPPPAAVAPPDAIAPPSPLPPAATPSPPPPPRVTTSSVPSSPVNKASVPSSPVNKAASSSVPSSPATRVSGAPSYSGVPSPTRTKATTISTTTSVPNSPANKLQTPSTSPPKPAISATNSPPSYKPLPPHTYSPPKPTTISSTAREANNYNNQSPKTIGSAVNQTPPQSPKLKQTAPPPSPHTLPLSQLRPNTSDNQTDQPKFPIEAEKTVLVQQKTIDQQKPNSWFSSFTSGNSKGADFREYPKPSNNSLSSKNEEETKERLISHKKSPSSSDHEAAGMRVITVAGENRGALMELIKSPKKHGSGEHSHYIHKKGNGKTLMGNQSDQSSYRSSSDSGGEEGKHKSKDKSHRAGKAAASKPTSAFMNSNVQGINNSIVYNSSLTHHDPGVHQAFSRKPNGAGFEAKSHHANGRNS